MVSGESSQRRLLLQQHIHTRYTYTHTHIHTNGSVVPGTVYTWEWLLAAVGGGGGELTLSPSSPSAMEASSARGSANEGAELVTEALLECRRNVPLLLDSLVPPVTAATAASHGC